MSVEQSLQVVSNGIIENNSNNLPTEGFIDQKKVAALMAEIDIAEPSGVMAYGAKPMGEVARFSDTLLDKIRAKDAEDVRLNLSELVMHIRQSDPLSVEEKSGHFLANIPIVGGLFKRTQRMVVNRQTLTQQIDIITGHLDNSMVNLVRDIEVLEQHYQHNYKFYNDLSVYIEAGKQKLAMIKKDELPALQLEAEASKDLMVAQKVKDMSEHINRFERRLHDLELSKLIAVQTAPQIRMIQSNNQQLAEKIQSSILATIPIWKSQLVLSLTLEAQGKAARLQKDVSDTTNQMLRKNAEILQQSSIATAHEVERSIVDIDTLREVQDKLVNTIEETMKIASDARVRRAETERELLSMEDNLKQRLTAAATGY